MRILPTLLCALGTVSALDINAFMAKLRTDQGVKTKDRSAKKSDRRNSAPAAYRPVQPSGDQSKSAKKLARKNNRSTQPPATTQPRPTTTRPQPVTTRRVPPTRRVVGKRPLGKRPVYRRPTGRPIAAGKATRRPTVRGRFRPVTRGTTKRPRVTNPPVTTPVVDLIAPEVLARRHFKAPSVLSAGGRLFGYKSLTEDIVEKEKVQHKTPFPTSDFEIAVQDSQVFSARQWTFGSGRSNLATSCWTCQGRSYADCLNNGSAQTCGADQSACFVREYTQSASNIIVYMGCQNMFQCVKDFNNNSPSVADGRGTQPTVVGYERYGHYSTAASCVPGVAGSVCHQCCAGSDNCNSSWASTAMSTINEWTSNTHTQNQT